MISTMTVLLAIYRAKLLLVISVARTSALTLQRLSFAGPTPPHVPRLRTPIMQVTSFDVVLTGELSQCPGLRPPLFPPLFATKRE